MKKKWFSLMLLVVFVVSAAAAPVTPAEAETIPFGSRTLYMGMSGSDVGELQTFLKDFGYYKFRASGYFDKKVRAGVIDFQKAHRLPADGVVDQDDYTKIAQLRNPVPPPPPPPPDPDPPSEPPADPQGTIYVVQPGDTFYLIAQRFNITLESLLAANPGVDPYQLQVGQEIIIPVPPPPPPPPPPAGPLHRYVSGYYAVDYWGDNRSYNSLKSYGKMINGVVTFCFLVDGSGNVSGSTPKDGVSLALSLGATPIALIHNFRNGGFNAADAHSLLTSSANRQRLIQNVITIMNRDGYKGVNIDLENVSYNDRAYYTALVREFQASLQPLGYLTTVSVPAKTWDAPTAAWSGAFDYAAIGTHADWVGIMTYDEHWAGGTPGPVASIGWVENVIKYAVTVIPREKILLGIATYGYDWTAGGCQMLTYQSVNQLIKTNSIQPLWHSTYGVPYFTYYKSGVKHEVWYENADAARLKFDLVNRYDLLGITIWRLGFEDGTFWEAVAEKL